MSTSTSGRKTSFKGHEASIDIVLGTISGACLGPVCVIVYTFFWYLVVARKLSDGGMGISGALVGAPYWIVFGALAGALGSFLGGIAIRRGKSVIYSGVAGLGAGFIIAIGGKLIFVNDSGAVSYMYITWASGFCIAGAIASLFSSDFHDLTHFLKWDYLRLVVIVVIAFLLTLLSLVYVRPMACHKLCVTEPCPSGTCREGELRSGFPFPIRRDNNLRQSPVLGLGAGRLGPEDVPSSPAFILNILFYSTILWPLWDRSWWSRLRHRLARV